MSSSVSISAFDSEAEVLMVLFNHARIGLTEKTTWTMSLEEAARELHGPRPRHIIMLHGRTMKLTFDGSDTIDCTAYDDANKYRGYAQEVLDRHLLGGRLLVTAGA